MPDALQGKNFAFIASGGRTGTMFLGSVLSDLIEDSFSVHEPDLLEGFSKRSLKAIRQFGLYHMVIGRLLGLTGIRNLNQKYLAHKLSDEAARASVLRHRAAYYGAIDAGLIIESYYQWFGLLPVLRQAFPGCKIVCIVRDPRTWVRSWANHGGRFDDKDYVTKLGQRRLDPEMIGDQGYAGKWQAMSPLAKNCWHWKVITELLVRECRENENARLFRYEDLFLAEDREAHMRELLAFVSHYEDRDYAYSMPGQTLDRVMNASKDGALSGWGDWPHALRTELDDICGPLMRELGYSLEADWL